VRYPALSSVLRLAGAVAITGAVGCVTGSATTEPSTSGALLSVADVIRDRDSLVGQQIAVVGRARAQPRPGDEQSPGGDTFPATLHLDEPSQSTATLLSLDVYRVTGAGRYEPYLCQVSGGTIRCGQYTPEVITTITGTWRREALPSGEIVYPDGRIEVSTWRTAYFLLVD
jgi:hypothetical protein